MEERKYKSMQYNYRAPEDHDGSALPLLIYIHGAGGRGHDLKNVGYPFTLEKYFKEHNTQMLIAAPLCEYDNWFMCFSELIDWVKFISASEGVDPTRVYIMGSSMGGYATWALLMCCPEIFAAGVPVCGGGMAWNTPRMKDVPIWAFHGALDPAVDVGESIKMVNTLRAAGGNVRLTVFPEMGHQIWDAVIYCTDLIDWLTKQKKN